MIETLSNIQPLLLIAMLITMYSIETVQPYLEKPAGNFSDRGVKETVRCCPKPLAFVSGS